MVYSKIKKILFILLCCLIIVFPFWCVRGLCSEQDISSEYVTYTDRHIDGTTRTIVEGFVEPLYVYTINKGGLYNLHNTAGVGHTVWRSNSLDIGSPVEYLGRISSSTDDVSFTAQSGDLIFLIASGGNTFTYELFFTPSSMENTVDGLVNNVGINNIWDIFDISINYIVVVVLVAFGLFIIFTIIRKLTKGKEGL